MNEAEVLAVARARQLASSGMGKVLREAAGLNGNDVAFALGVEPSTVWQWEHGNQVPRRDQAIRYLNFLLQVDSEMRDLIQALRICEGQLRGMVE